MESTSLSRAFLPYWVSLVCTVVFAVSGCGETVLDPFEGSGRFFTVYGYLDFRETEHAVRVIPLSRNRELIDGPGSTQATIDATVSTTDLGTGVRTVWTHSLSPLDDGTFGHIFRASFRVQPQHTYRLEVLRSDGITATAETTVPYFGTPTLFELGPVVFSADSSEVYQDVRMPGLSSPWQMDVAYLWGSIGRNFRTDIAYDRAGVRGEDGAWQVRIQISQDQPRLRASMSEQLSLFNLEEDAPVGVHSLGIRVHVLDENWDPQDGIFDPEVLVKPGTLSNVNNGYGFFGSVGVYQQLWNIQNLSVALGYDF